MCLEAELKQHVRQRRWSPLRDQGTIGLGLVRTSKIDQLLCGASDKAVALAKTAVGYWQARQNKKS